MEIAEEFQVFEEKIKKEAEELVLKKFPRYMHELDDLLQSDLFAQANLDRIRSDPNIPIPEVSHVSIDIPGATKKRKIDESISPMMGSCPITNQLPATTSATKQPQHYKPILFPNGPSPINPTIAEIIDLIKPKVNQLSNDARVVVMWLNFLIPRIEDGNNFGVDIQEQTLMQVQLVEKKAKMTYMDIGEYFESRGDMIAKISKYPHIDDYRRRLTEMDEKEFWALQEVMTDLRDHYATLYDIIVKNLDKIKKPRTSNHDNMY